MAPVLCLLSSPLAEARQLNQNTVNIVPKPVSIQRHAENFSLTRQTKLVTEGAGARQLADLFNEHLLKIYGFKLDNASRIPASGNFILLTASSSGDLPAEGYRLTADAKAVRVAGQPDGLFYGVQSLIQLLPLQPKVPLSVPGV
jgi:hexosaminidase